MATNPLHEDGGTLERPSDTGKDPEGFAKRWILELSQADATEKDWREKARECIRIYRGDKAEYFNILFSNTSTLLPAIFNQTPTPDVRRRFRDPDPIGKQVAEGLERVISYTFDQYDFVNEMKQTLSDQLLTGRGQARVRYNPETVEDEEGNEEISRQELWVELVPWDRFRVSPARTWRDVRWVSYQHLMTKEELEAAFPEHAKEVKLDHSYKSDDAKDGPDEDEDVYKRAVVEEIWDKETRQVIWLCPSYSESVLRIDEDPLGLQDFFDCPRPAYSIPTPDGLVPIPEYTVYENQAKELNRITSRINKLIDSLRVRGVYDSSIEELQQVYSSDENELIPSDNILAALSAGKGDLNSAIWFAPIEAPMAVLQQLYINRDQIKQTIYEITGISDIVRGSTDPRETLGAQQIKAQFGTLRIDERRREVSRFVRDLVRIKAEIIAEHFEPEILSLIVGDEVTQEHLKVLRNDLLRAIKVDIETDSTVAAEMAEDKQEVTELIQGISQYFQGMAGVVEPQGPVPLDTAKAILLAGLRRFKLGRQVEDAIEAIGSKDEGEGQNPQVQQAQQAQQQAMQQAAQAQQMQVQAEQQAAQAKMAEQQAKMQAVQIKAQAEQQKLQMQGQMEQLKAQLVQAGIQLEMKQDATQHDYKMNEFDRKEEFDQAKFERDMQKLGAQAAHDEASFRQGIGQMGAQRQLQAEKSEHEREKIRSSNASDNG